MPSLNHTHIYRRVKKNKNLWMCAEPKCSHTNKRELLEGKATRCNNCHDEFILTSQDLKRAFPMCMNCRNTKEARVFKESKKKIVSILGDLLKETEEEI